MSLIMSLPLKYKIDEIKEGHLLKLYYKITRL